MPRPGDIFGNGQEYLSVSEDLQWLNEATGGKGLARGGTYLVAGEPGIGKTTLMLQAGGDFAQLGEKVLYVTTEQNPADVTRGLQRIYGSEDGRLSSGILENFFIDDSVDDIDALPKFLTRRVLTDGQDYQGTKVIIVDSIQGRGLSSTATRKYRALYEFEEIAKAQGIVILLVGHVTKKGQLAGPKDLEHNVDCVLYFRRAFRLRPLFVPKNRFGPAVINPIVLMMDDRGRLSKSPLNAAKSAAVYGYTGIGNDLAEGQAAVSLPTYGSRPELIAPFLPGKKIKQLLAVLSFLKDVDIADLSYQINCYLPGQQRYRGELDLPLAVALLSSYLQLSVDRETLFVGELDLTGRIRPPEQAYLESLAELLLSSQRGKIRRVFVSNEAVLSLSEIQPDSGPRVGEVVDVMGVADLETLLRELWPVLFMG